MLHAAMSGKQPPRGLPRHAAASPAARSPHAPAGMVLCSADSQSWKEGEPGPHGAFVRAACCRPGMGIGGRRMLAAARFNTLWRI